MNTDLDLFRTSLMGRSSLGRVAGVLLLLLALWAAIAWAVALP